MDEGVKNVKSSTNVNAQTQKFRPHGGLSFGLRISFGFRPSGFRIWDWWSTIVSQTRRATSAQLSVQLSNCCAQSVAKYPIFGMTRCWHELCIETASSRVSINRAGVPQLVSTQTSIYENNPNSGVGQRSESALPWVKSNQHGTG